MKKIRKNIKDATELIRSNKINLAYQKLNIFKLNDTIAIIKYLDKKPNSEVMNIVKGLKSEQSLISNKLRKMKELNIVFSEKEGKFVRYSNNVEEIERISNSVKKFNEHEKKYKRP